MLRQGESDESRYDPATTDRIIRLASRFESEAKDKLSADEIEKIADEIGIEVQHVRKALAQVASDEVAGKLQRRKAKPEPKEGHTNAEFWSTVAAFVIPMVYAAIAYFVSNGDITTGRFYTMIAPLPLALMLGFIAGNKKVGFFASLVLVLALWPALDRVLTSESKIVLRREGVTVGTPVPDLDKLRDLAEFGFGMDVAEAKARVAGLEAALREIGITSEERAQLEKQLRDAKADLASAEALQENMPKGDSDAARSADSTRCTWFERRHVRSPRYRTAEEAHPDARVRLHLRRHPRRGGWRHSPAVFPFPQKQGEFCAGRP